jgi:predicted  nucleic acid-binding Zn-ribbon protein
MPKSKHEDRVRDAHEEAIFGVPTTSYVHTEAAEDEPKANDEEKAEAQPSSSLISDKVRLSNSNSFPCFFVITVHHKVTLEMISLGSGNAKGFLERTGSEVAAGF